MKTVHARRREVILGRIPLIAAAWSFAVGWIVLMSWLFGWPGLRELHPMLGTMGPRAAICFIPAGLALGLLRREGITGWWRGLGHACAGGVVLMSLIVLAEVLFDWTLNLDQRIFRGALATIFPGTLPPATAWAFLCLGAALLLLDLKVTRFHPSEIGAAIAALIVLLALVAYGYGFMSVVQSTFRRPLAIHTLLTLLALSVGILTARPQRGLMALLLSDRIDGVMVRRLLPAAIGLPVLVGWLVMEGQRLGWYPGTLNAAYYTILIVVLFTLLVLLTAATLTQIDTQRLQAEQEIRLLNAELEQRVARRTAELEAANKELESFSYSVSHDLRAPLRHIQGYAVMLEKEIAPHLTDKARRFLSTIVSAGREMGQLIDDLLAFSRMGRSELRETIVEPAHLVESVRKDLELVTRDRHIRWIIAPLPPARGDPGLLKQVFANLLGNAVKYSRGRDPAEIEVGCAGEENGQLVYFVRDNGAGFDMRYADKLFGVFQRLHRADEFEGTGIGLATVRRIITRHGGRIWAEGRLDAGARFAFTLPRAPSARLHSSSWAATS
jgi:signal transduction histidine kinase